MGLNFINKLTKSASPSYDEKERENVSVNSADGLGTESRILEAGDPHASDSSILNLGNGEIIDKTSDDRKQIGVMSAVFLIFNRMVGTGIFATPSTIYLLSGSVGLALIMWVVGALIAGAGLMVYLEWGTTIPKNGGEKNYLEYVYRKPKFLITAMFASYVFLLGWAAPNSVIFGEYILNAAEVPVTRWNQRGIGLGCLSFCFIIHSVSVKWGLRLQNFLGVFKLIVIALITIVGWVALGGGLKNVKEPHANFHNAFSGSEKATGYGIVMALYNVIWSFIGYSNANYALSEAKNPVRTLKIAGPLALIMVAIFYMFCNISYFAVVPREQIGESGRILAATFFRVAFNESAEKAMSVFVALSALGNVLSVIFSQGRIIQELGREGVLPFSSFFASNKPFNSPFPGLFEHYCVSIIILLAPPPGDAYNFISNLITYPLSAINVVVSLGLLWVHFDKWRHNRNPNLPPSIFADFNPPIKATIPVTIFFMLASLYLVVAPFLSPDADQSVYKDLPYWLHCVVGIALFAAGAIYWLFWAIICPKLFSYKLVKQTVIGSDGWSRTVINRVKKGEVAEGDEF